MRTVVAVSTAVFCVLFSVLSACSGGSGNPPPPPNPPKVFLTSATNNVVGTSFDLTVNVTGCDAVDELDIQQSGTTLKSFPYKGNNTKVTLTGGDVQPLYGQLGIAADMTLKAKAVCHDGRTNTSTALGLQFFPVKSVYQAPNQPITLPDSFVAEGGVGAQPVTFIGCADTGMGLQLVRVDTLGNVMAVAPNQPFACDYNASISPKLNGGIRWLFQPTQGAFAFDENLNVTGGITGNSFTVFGTGPDGNAVIWDNMQTTDPPLYKVLYNNGVDVPGGQSTFWVSMVHGVVNGTPLVDPSSGTLYVPAWSGAVGSNTGTITVQFVNYNMVGGVITGEHDLLTQSYGAFDAPVVPNVAFSPNAQTIYIPYSTSSGTQSGVMACPTTGTGTGCTPRWKSPLVDGVILYVVPYANGSRIAAISATSIWFLDNNDGSILNPFGVPTVAGGSLTIAAIQPGNGPDFYILNTAPSSFPSEIIAFDQAENGEVWRYSLDGAATTAQSGLTIAIDDSGASWLRIGINQVLPLPLGEYRQARGPTMPPMP
jgi:hypothetical protein